MPFPPGVPRYPQRNVHCLSNDSVFLTYTKTYPDTGWEWEIIQNPRDVQRGLIWRQSQKTSHRRQVRRSARQIKRQGACKIMAEHTIYEHLADLALPQKNELRGNPDMALLFRYGIQKLMERASPPRLIHPKIKCVKSMDADHLFEISGFCIHLFSEILGIMDQVNRWDFGK